MILITLGDFVKNYKPQTISGIMFSHIQHCGDFNIKHAAAFCDNLNATVQLPPLTDPTPLHIRVLYPYKAPKHLLKYKNKH